MSLVKSNPAAETEGLAPKVAWPTLALAVLGAVLMIVDLAGLADLEDEIWITLLSAAAGVLGIGYKSKPALQRAPTTYQGRDI
jgi:hypothetical protein